MAVHFMCRTIKSAGLGTNPRPSVLSRTRQLPIMGFATLGVAVDFNYPYEKQPLLSVQI